MKKIGKTLQGGYQFLVWGNYATNGINVCYKDDIEDLFKIRKVSKNALISKEEHLELMNKSFNDEKIEYVETNDIKVNLILAYLNIEPNKLIKKNDIMVNIILARNCSPSTLQILSKDKSDLVRREVALRADEKIIPLLINDPSDIVREKLISNLISRTDIVNLKKIVNDPSVRVRIAVSKINDIDILKNLMNDEDQGVRLSVCEHNNIEICVQMINDEYFKVRAHLASLDIDEISLILMNDELYVREHVAKYCTNIDILTKLIKTDNSLIRRHIAKRNIPELYYLFSEEKDQLILKDLKNLNKELYNEKHNKYV